MENSSRPSGETVKKGVREYYGKELKRSSDLKTGACKCSGNMSDEVKEALALVDDEIIERSYGCGSPIPPLLEGKTVLDLGCGTGKDVYIASKLVGGSGSVIGVDMTPEQLEVAKRHEADQMARFGYRKSNVRFLQGYIEDLKSLGIGDGTVDVVISNCVINLSPDKEKVFSEIYRVLKKGGELYFSDVFADRRVPDSVYADPVVRSECLGGAMYDGDFRRLMAQVGFADFRYTASSPVTVDDPAIKAAIGDAAFTSRTVRAFKVDGLEDTCEDYGQMAAYMGNIPGYPDLFDLDDHHRFRRGIWKKVCGNTAAMISGSRYSSAFAVKGDRSVHYGSFDCSSDDVPDPCGSGCCCCR